MKVSGLQRLKELRNQFPLEKEDKKTPPINGSPETPPVVGDLAIPDYADMIAEFEVFLNTHPLVKSLKLRLATSKPQHYYIYQGSPSSIWATLKPKGCYFYRTSLLRNVRKLPADHVLARYFKDYSLTGGSNVMAKL